METEPTIRVDQRILQERVVLIFFFLLLVAVIIKNAWLSDDAFITLRTVRNFNEGYGLVWNTHERVQAYTHPLWMLLLSFMYFVTAETYFSTIFISILLSATAVALIVFKISKKLTRGLLVLLLLAFSKAFIDYTTSGLENPLNYFLLVLFFWLFIEGTISLRRLFWLTFIAALCMTTRMDIILLVGPALLYRFYETWNKAHRWRTTLSLLVGGLPFAGWTLFSIIYYGFPFPNTAYAKLSNKADSMEILQQGFFYLIDSLSVDPITLVTISLAVVYAVLSGNRRLAFISCGIVLYILYIIQIGGDFMTGRFLSTPYLLAVLILQNLSLSLKEMTTHIFTGGIIFVGLLNTAQSPVFSNASYEWTTIGKHGIADERGHYYPDYGLMSASRQERLVEQGFVRGTDEPTNFIHCGIGFRGFSASPHTRLIDYCGLADALMARLPTRYDPRWRVGHPIRQVPPGYLGTLRTGINQIGNPDVALFYDKLAKITQGELFSQERFIEIWRFNIGAYNYLLNLEKLRFPFIVELSLVDNPSPKSQVTSIISDELFFTEDFEFELNYQGVRIDLGKRQHPTHLDVGLNSFYSEVVYFLDGYEIGRQTVTEWPLTLAERPYSVVTVPPSITEMGFDMIRISPRIGLKHHRFTYINLLNLDLLNQRIDSHVLSVNELRELLQLYYYTFYRAEGATRDLLLDKLLTQLQNVEAEQWSQIPRSIFYELLPIPAPQLHEILLAQLPDILLTDAQGHPQLRYIGSLEPDIITVDGKRELQLNLYFLVEEAIKEQYSLWFDIKHKKENASGEDESEEWMIWDFFSDKATWRWGPGMPLHLQPEIKFKPGEYEITFGFWTENDRKRLYVAGTENYWIHLDKQIVE